MYIILKTKNTFKKTVLENKKLYMGVKLKELFMSKKVVLTFSMVLLKYFGKGFKRGIVTAHMHVKNFVNNT